MMSEEMVCRKRRLSSFQIIILGFAGVILLGALLLMLPISATARCVTPFHEALFTATCWSTGIPSIRSSVFFIRRTSISMAR